MTSMFEYWATRAAEPLWSVHGDSATHKAATTGTETAITVLLGEFSESEGLEHGQVVVREADITVVRGDYLTFDSRTWRVLEVVTEEDGLATCELIRATEVN